MRGYVPHPSVSANWCQMGLPPPSHPPACTLVPARCAPHNPLQLSTAHSPLFFLKELAANKQRCPTAIWTRCGTIGAERACAARHAMARSFVRSFARSCSHSVLPCHAMPCHAMPCHALDRRNPLETYFALGEGGGPGGVVHPIMAA